MLQNFLKTFFLFAVLLGSLPVAAVEKASPIGIALFPPLQFPDTEYSITGVRLGLVNVNRSVSGLDLGLLGNVTKQSFTGIAIAGLFNYNNISADITGLQIAGLANINGTGSTLYGVQIGAYNSVSNVYGVQIGLINVAQKLNGIQIGLLNFNASGPFKASPIINASF